ncbi:MAG: hypothetical protein QMD65_02825 [Patescibacteria group bacterium]|nr:hypothetical protein [Patescibacteria group bacterium]
MNSPFSSETPEINPVKKEKYGTFKNYHQKESVYLLSTPFWIVFLIILWFVALISWVGQIIWWIILAFIFLFDGSLPRWLGIIP